MTENKTILKKIKTNSFKQQLQTSKIDIKKNRKGEFVFNLKSLPFLADHAFQDMIVLPGSAYIEMALIVYELIYYRTPCSVKNINFENIITLSDDYTRVAFNFNSDLNEKIKISFAEGNVESSGLDDSTSTTMLLSNELHLKSLILDNMNVADFIENSSQSIEGEKFYGKLNENGNQYGPKFQNIKEIWLKKNEALGRFTSTEENFSSMGDHYLHPSLLDSFAQLLSSLSESNGRTFVLNSIKVLEIIDLEFPDKVWCKATLNNENGQQDGFTGDLVVFDSNNKVYLQLMGVKFKYLERVEEKTEVEYKGEIDIVSTFTVDPVEDTLKFWFNEFKSPYKINFAPYNQVFQELLNPNSSFYKNTEGFNVILLSLEDWAKDEKLLTPKISSEKLNELLAEKSKYLLPNKILIAHLNKYETDYVYKEIFEDKAYLKHGITINDGDTVIDIGANIGLFTLFVNQQAKNANVYSFEPSPVVFELLKTNSAIYGDNVKAFNYGVSDKKKKAEFTFYATSSVFSSFNADEEEDKAAIQAVVRNMFNEISSDDTGDLEEYIDEITSGRLESKNYECQLISVSDIIEENNIEKIDLLKIDAEKSELDILKGIKDSHWDKIKQIVIEIHDKEGDIFEEVKSILTAKGFHFAVEEEEFLKDSGLYNIFASKENDGKQLNQEKELITRKKEQLEENINNFVSAIRSYTQKTKTPVILGVTERSPEIKSDPYLKRLFDSYEEELFAELNGINNLNFIRSDEILDKYPVNEYFDIHGNELGHIPYTEKYYTSLGTLLARRIYSLTNKSYKVIALDCDNTLWKGVCGEDGVDGIQITESNKNLQEFILRQINAGMVVCLCSKNNEGDVWEIFDKREDMLLKREHIVSAKINWNMKSDNLKILAKELNLGLDSFIFIDDNPVECGEVKINCPEVLSLQLPRDEKVIPSFLKNIWAFDHLKLTEEDKKRTRMYKENVQREKYRESSISLTDFLKGLNLQINISTPNEDQLKRVSQLTFRTNQFNFTTIRRSESEIQELLSNGYKCLLAEVSDRFGDYGLVSVLLYSVEPDTLKVDTFLLSCRVLGRGVEHKLLSELGSIAAKLDLKKVELKYVPSAKNRPALEFIEEIGSEFGLDKDGYKTFSFPIEYLLELKYEPDSTENNKSNDPKEKSASGQLSSKVVGNDINISEILQKVADNFGEVKSIQARVEEFILSAPGEESKGFIEPESDTEKQISAIWQKVLGRSKVGVNDNFFEIGGTSLKTVQLIALLKKEMGLNISIVKLFECPTVALLSKALSNDQIESDSKAFDEIAERGKRRREKRVIRRR